MAAAMPDRAIFLFGGQYGEKLYDDLWQYNVNTNMWNNVILEDAKTLLNRGGPADIAAAKFELGRLTPQKEEKTKLKAITAPQAKEAALNRLGSKNPNLLAALKNI
jgi:hypothetical protein